MSDTSDLATATVVAPAAAEHARKHDVEVRYEQVQLIVKVCTHKAAVFSLLALPAVPGREGPSHRHGFD